MNFSSFEDILDFAILQEKAAQQLYSKLSEEVDDPNVRLFYRTLKDEEHLHELKLRELKRFGYDLVEPDIQTLKESGYLDAMPIEPDISFAEAVRYAVKKECSARILYRTLGQMCERKELQELFNELASQEGEHAAHFRTEYKDLFSE